MGRLFPFLGDGRAGVDVVSHPCQFERIAMELDEVFGDLLPCGTEPGAFANSVTRIDRVRALRAQVCVPGRITATHRLRKRLAMGIGACTASQVTAFADPTLVTKNVMGGFDLPSPRGKEEPGDGLTRACARVRVPGRRSPARDLRQHEARGRCDLHRAGAAL